MNIKILLVAPVRELVSSCGNGEYYERSLGHVHGREEEDGNGGDEIYADCLNLNVV